MNKRIHAYYNGRVQGVGFRFSAQKLAVDFSLTGWVKNLPDGRVEFLGEGKEESLHRVLAKIDTEFSNYIRKKEVTWLPASGEFEQFEIRFF